METLQLTERDVSFIKEVEEQSGSDLSSCYQCGKCTAGCPASFLYDKQVSQLMRAAQLGLSEQALTSKSLWLCLSCSACTQRCPNNIDVANVMNTLRQKARDKGYINSRPTEMFWKAFLDTVNATGRTYELGVMLDYMMRTGRFFTGIDIVFPSMVRHKLPLMPHIIKGKSEVGRIFEKYSQKKMLKTKK